MNNKSISEHNKILTEVYLKQEPEGQYFDRKSIAIKPRDLAKTIIAFANAAGGILAVGIDDNGEFEGINSVGQEKINNIINSYRDFCVPPPKIKYEILDIKNKNNKDDKIIIFHIEPSYNKMIKAVDESVYLRIGDKSNRLAIEEIRALQYDKGERAFEEEIAEFATIDDLDKEILQIYRENVGSLLLNDEELLESRGLIVNKDGKKCLTYGAILLFAKYPIKFYPNSRIRFIRYDGKNAQVGTDLNIVKEINIEGPLHKIIEQTKIVINSQLRDLNTLDRKTGKFITIPEYPEFAWQEGVVNAVTHRDYSLRGEHIKIIMFDDRLEIQSPGKLPNSVTLENIKTSRYSRNPRIARILTEFNWVKELGEGVDRIYKDMENYFLEEPEYEEPGNCVKLTLKNNIEMRGIRDKEYIKNNISVAIWEGLKANEKSVLQYLIVNGRGTTNEIAQSIKINNRNVRKILNKFVDNGIINWVGNHKNDPTQYYEFINRKNKLT